jgi:hypothetical protein
MNRWIYAWAEWPTVTRCQGMLGRRDRGVPFDHRIFLACEATGSTVFSQWTERRTRSLRPKKTLADLFWSRAPQLMMEKLA